MDISQGQVLVQSLTDEDRQFLTDQRHSEHFKVFQKVLSYMYWLECSKLALVPQSEFPVYQGKLQGLLAAKNILAHGKISDK